MIKEWLTQLTSRERLVVMLGGIILIGVIGEVMIGEPFIHALKQLETSVIAQQATLTWMEQAAQEIQRLRRSSRPSSVSSSSLLLLIDESLRNHALQKAVVEPQGEEVNVSFETVSFTQMIQWLEKLYRQQQVKVKNIRIERQVEEADQVKVKITF